MKNSVLEIKATRKKGLRETSAARRLEESPKGRKNKAERGENSSYLMMVWRHLDIRDRGTEGVGLGG